MFANILLLAALICTENADGTWTCSSDGPSLDPDSGIVIDPEGNYTCTNCIAISSNECDRIKSMVISNCDEIIGATLDTRGYATNLREQLQSLLTTFSNFEECPYHYSSDTGDITNQPGFDSSFETSTDKYEDLWNKMVSAWESSPNYGIVAIQAVPPESYSVRNMWKSVNYLVGLWQASYAVAQNTTNQLNRALSTIQDVINGTRRAQSSAEDIYTQTLDSVTCAPCTLGSSTGGGGGSGSQTGCLDCYLNYLSSMDSNLDSINDALQALKPQLETYITRVRSVIERNFDTPLSSLSNLVSRIDDYLQIDQQQNLITIKEAVISMTNQVHYFDDYILADLYKDHLDQQFDMNQAISEIPEGGGDTWDNLTWFSRVEALLGSVAGFGSSISSDEVDSSILDDYDQAMGVVESDSSGNEARQSITTVFESLEDVLNAFNIFEGVSEPSQIFLLDRADLPLHSSSDTASITIQVPDTPALITFLRFVRNAFIAFYWFAALVGFAFAVVKLYSTVVSILRWSSSFLGTIFGG